jgi:xanthine dehydrogenase/oxidase
LQWWRPTKLEELLLIKRTTTDAKIVVGSSEVTIEVNLKRGKEPYRVLVSPQAVPELNTFTENEEGAVIGGAVSLTRVGGYLKTLIKKHPEHKTSTFRAVVEQLKWFAGHQIRNVASLAGNIATASPISDINPVLAAAGAYITVQTCGEEPRKVYLDRKFFLGYRTIVLQPTDVIITVHIPFTREHEYVTAYKQARRKDDDIAIVSGCFRTLLVQAGDNWVIQKASLCYGGMAPISKLCASRSSISAKPFRY